MGKTLLSSERTKRVKKFSLKLLGIYLIFLTALFSASSEERVEIKSIGDDTRKVEEESIWRKPEYTVIIPKSASEVLMERQGQYVYSGMGLDLTSLSGEEKKSVFINLLLPAIEVVEREIKWKRSLVETLSKKEELNAGEREYLEELFTQYRADSIESLLPKMVMPPKSLVISQAALESGWGTSRFFKEGNNVFGVWSYDETEPRMAARKSREEGFTAYLKSYPDLKGAIEDYVLLLSKSSNYRELRGGLRREEGSLKLAEYLVRYSELGDEYVRRLKSVIRSNRLNELD